MEPIHEIAKRLRCTDKMAEAFVKSVREKLGQDASEEMILAAVRRLPPRAISITKVVASVRQELNRKPRRPSRRSPAEIIRPATNTSLPLPGRAESDTPAEDKPRPSRLREARRTPAGRTQLDLLEEILSANWARAEREGFRPERLSGPDFIRAVHLNCDPRDATRSRIVKACQRIDRQDVIITPPLVADIIREEV
jgi:hypothetical protein